MHLYGGGKLIPDQLYCQEQLAKLKKREIKPIFEESLQVTELEAATFCRGNSEVVRRTFNFLPYINFKKLNILTRLLICFIL